MNTRPRNLPRRVGAALLALELAGQQRVVPIAVEGKARWTAVVTAPDDRAQAWRMNQRRRTLVQRDDRRRIAHGQELPPAGDHAAIMEWMLRHLGKRSAEYPFQPSVRQGAFGTFAHTRTVPVPAESFFVLKIRMKPPSLSTLLRHSDPNR